MKSGTLDLQGAKTLSREFLDGAPRPANFSYVILDEYTIERELCFVFFYESSKFLETDKFEDRLVGNGPILVNRHSREVRQLGTALPVESYIEEYERSIG